MSGVRPPDLCPTCRHVSENGKVCYSFEAHQFKDGVCMAYEPKPDSNNEKLNEDKR